MRFSLALGMIVAAVLLTQSPVFAVDWSWPMGQLNAVNAKEIDKAQGLYSSGEIDSAIQVLSTLKGLPGDDCRARHVISEIYKEQKRYQDARRELHELITVINTYTSTHTVTPPWMDTVPIKIEMGDLSAQDGNLNEALAQYQEILQSRPKNVLALAQIARIYEMQRDFEGAKAQYKVILEASVSPGEKSYYTDRIAELDKAIAAARNSGQPQGPAGGAPTGPGTQGTTGMSPGRMPPAGGAQVLSGPGGQLIASGKAATTTTGAPNPLRLALEEITNRKYDSAIPLLKKVLQTSPTSGQAHYLLGVAYAGDHQFDAARGEYETAIKCSQDIQLQGLAKKALSKLH